MKKQMKTKPLAKQNLDINKPEDIAKISKQIVNIFGDLIKWPLHSGKYHRLKAAIYFKEQSGLQISNLLILQLYSNKQPSILSHIGGCVFNNLQELNMKNNKITSIESLSRLNAPCLTKINLSDNNIVRVSSSLNKSMIGTHNESKFQSLILYANNIAEINFPMWQNISSAQKIALDSKQSQKNGENSQQIHGQIIVGINSISDFTWLNKLRLPNRLKLSLENNRSNGLIKASDLEHWNLCPDYTLL